MLNQEQLTDAAYGGAAAALAVVMRAPIGLRISLSTIVAGVTVSYIFAKPIAHWLAMSPEWRVPLSCALGFLAFYILAGVTTLGKEWAREPWHTIARFTFLRSFVSDREDSHANNRKRS